MNSWIDLTIPVHDEMLIFPGDPVYRWQQVLFKSKGDVCNLSRMELGCHTGTHLDSPRHMIADGAVIEDFDINQLCGTAYVAQIEGGGDITADSLEHANIPAGVERLLLRTENTTRDLLNPPFQADFCAFDLSAAQWLVSKGIRVIGLDFLTIEHSPDQSFPVHKCMLGSGMAVIEGVATKDAPLGMVELVCAPMRLLVAEGAPCRVLVRPI